MQCSSSPDGPWTKIDDLEDSCDIYQAPISLLLKQALFKYQNSFQQNLSIQQCKKDFFRIREIYPNLPALCLHPTLFIGPQINMLKHYNHCESMLAITKKKNTYLPYLCLFSRYQGLPFTFKSRKSRLPTLEIWKSH